MLQTHKIQRLFGKGLKVNAIFNDMNALLNNIFSSRSKLIYNKMSLNILEKENIVGKGENTDKILKFQMKKIYRKILGNKNKRAMMALESLT